MSWLSSAPPAVSDPKVYAFWVAGALSHTPRIANGAAVGSIVSERRIAEADVDWIDRTGIKSASVSQSARTISEVRIAKESLKLPGTRQLCLVLGVALVVCPMFLERCLACYGLAPIKLTIHSEPCSHG